MLGLLTNVVLADKPKPKFKPNINESKEYENVIHSPAADSTPKVFRSVLQMEIVVKRGEKEPEIIYANGTAISKEGLLVSVVDEPRPKADALSIESASVLLLGGEGAEAELISFDPTYGVAIFDAKGLTTPRLRLSNAPPVANRRTNWSTVYRAGEKTILYSRPLRIHKSTFKHGEAADLCEVIDHGTSALTAERSGSAIVAYDGSLVALMGRLKHWNVTPKNVKPRYKTAWAVPASVIKRLVQQAEKEASAKTAAK